MFKIVSIVLIITLSLAEPTVTFSLKRFILNELSQDVKDTVPLTDKELLSLLDKFALYNQNNNCCSSESCANEWVQDYNLLIEKINEKSALIEYEFDTNLTEDNQKRVDDFAYIPNKFQELSLKMAKQFVKSCHSWQAPLRRMLYLASLGTVTKDPADTIKLSNLTNQLMSIYGMAKVCTKSICLKLEPDITTIMSQSRNYDQLLYAWKGWHDATGPKMRDMFTETVQLLNKDARENGYKDLSERWLEDFEETNFEKTFDDLFNEIKPLYQLLHKYVKRKLDLVYGDKYAASHNSSLIQAHLVGNVWAQEWDNIYDLVAPYPNVKEITVTKSLIEKNFTSLDFFKEAERFFVSIGLYKMTIAFWKYSLIDRPADREVQCHASAFDFYNGFDYRIKMCTAIDEVDFATAHHEMGHIQYYMAYKSQPAIFRTGANSGFHEAIGDTIALSVLSPKHLKKINLIESDQITKEQDLNFLMKQALKKIAFLPFGYLMDKWRWNVFRNRINESNYNQKWWQMRNEYQGLESPVTRTENDFDPGAKFHVASYTPYSRYFVSHLHQFQFYKALCKLSDHKGPLHKCDFYGSKAAGAQLKKMLKLGASKHWKYALEELTGERALNANALFEYFSPLIKYLEEEDKKYNNFM